MDLGPRHISASCCFVMGLSAMGLGAGRGAAARLLLAGVQGVGPSPLRSHSLRKRRAGSCGCQGGWCELGGGVVSA